MKKTRGYRLYVSDILHAIEGIETYTASMSFDDFLQDQKTRDAVVWNIAVIGEASKRIPKTLRQKYKDLPWTDMAKMRDKISHAYFGIRYEIVWNVIRGRLHEIKPMLQTMLTDLQEDSLFEK